MAPNAQRPQLLGGDIWLHLRRDGAITFAVADLKPFYVPLPTAIEFAEAAHEDGAKVFLSSDGPDSYGAREALTKLDVTIVPHEAGPPAESRRGITALMGAAAKGNDVILDDLIERGVDVHAADNEGSTALHHAAARGQTHAIRSLVAADSDIEQANSDGLRPYDVAVGAQQQDAVELLVSLGAKPQPAGPIRFRRIHYGQVVAIPIIVAANVAVAIGMTFWHPIASVIYLAFCAAFILLIGPPRAWWAGGVPRTLDGSRLTLRRWNGQRIVVDLATVRFLASGRSLGPKPKAGLPWSGLPRWIAPCLLLAHRDGVPVKRRRDFQRMHVPSNDEIDLLVRRNERWVVVVLDTWRWYEVVVPVANVLAARKVEMSPTMRDLVLLAQHRAALEHQKAAKRAARRRGRS